MWWEGRRRGGGKRKWVEREDEQEVEENKATRGRSRGGAGEIVMVR